MGMKASSGYFVGTQGNMKYKLDIQYFASGKIPIKGRVLLKLAKSQPLKNTIKELYRPGANVGDGGTAAAIKKQLKTGVLVGGRDHTVKGRERITNLNKLLAKGNLNKTDTIIATKLRNDLQKALGGSNEKK